MPYRHPEGPGLSQLPSFGEKIFKWKFGINIKQNKVTNQYQSKSTEFECLKEFNQFFKGISN